MCQMELEEYGDYDVENKERNQDILIRREEERVKSVQKISDSNFNAVILQGQSALKSVLLINAGAVVSVLAFYSGHMELLLSADLRITELYRMLLDALRCWSVGVGTSAVAYGATYLSQSCVAKNFNQGLSEFKDAIWFNKNARIDASKWGIRWQCAAVMLVIIGYVCFLPEYVWRILHLSHFLLCEFWGITYEMYISNEGKTSISGWM